MERMNLFQDNNKPQITFYFAECMEFPDYGEYKEFPSLAQAISLFEKCPGTLLNAVNVQALFYMMTVFTTMSSNH